LIESKKSQSFSTNQEKLLLLEVTKNKTSKSNRTDLDYLPIYNKSIETKDFNEFKEKISEEKLEKKQQKIVNTDKIMNKFRKILRETRKRLIMREYQKTKTRNTQFINDITMEIASEKRIRKPIFNMIILTISKLSKRLYDILSGGLIFWRIFYIFFVVFISFFLTIEYFFQGNTILTDRFYWIIALWALLFNSAFSHIIGKNQIKVSYKKMCYDYIKSWFFLDFACFIVIIMNISMVLSAKKLWSLIYLSQFYNYQSMKFLILRKVFLHKKSQNFIMLILIVIKTIILAHFLACFAYYLENDIQSVVFEWDSQYLSAFHDKLSLLFLINSQNIQFSNEKTKGFSCFAILVSGFWFLYVLRFFLKSFEKKKRINENLDEKHYKNFLNCMQKFHMRKDLIIKIKDYLEGENKKHKNTLISLTENQAFNLLSANLKEDFLAATQIKIFGALPILNKNFSEGFLRKLLPKMSLTQYNPENIIYNVYFICFFEFFEFFHLEIGF